MGLITKKDVIRNMAALEENDQENEDELDTFEVHEGVYDNGLLDGDERRRSPESR